MASHWWNRLLKLCLFAEKQLLYNADKCEKLIQIRWFQVLLNDSCFRDPLLPSCEPRFPEALDPQIGDKKQRPQNDVTTDDAMAFKCCKCVDPILLMWCFDALLLSDVGYTFVYRNPL